MKINFQRWQSLTRAPVITKMQVGKNMSFFKTPRDIMKRRKRLKLLGMIALSIVFFHALTKYLLDKGTLNIWIFDTAYAILAIGILIIAIYGSDRIVSKLCRHKDDNKTS